MRCFAISLVALSLGGCVASVGRLDRLRVELTPSATPNRPVLVVAHRGCWKDGHPENSLTAVRACIAMGVDVAELDARRTADGVLVLMHDSTVDRTTNGRGAVKDLTYPQIAALKLRAGAGGPDAPLTDEAPPSFEAAMTAARGAILVNLDAKADVYDDAFKVLERTGTTGQVIMKRRVAPSDPRLAQQAPFDRVFAMPIADQVAGPAGVLLASQLHPAPPAVELIFTDVAFLDEAARVTAPGGARLWVNTLKPEFAAGLTDREAVADPDGTWGRLIRAGVTMIQTDEPRRLLAYLRTMNRRSIGSNANRRDGQK